MHNIPRIRNSGTSALYITSRFMCIEVHRSREGTSINQYLSISPCHTPTKLYFQNQSCQKKILHPCQTVLIQQWFNILLNSISYRIYVFNIISQYNTYIHNTYVHIYTWNPNDLYFWRSTPQNKAFSNQNKGHLGSRYIYIIYTNRSETSPCSTKGWVREPRSCKALKPQLSSRHSSSTCRGS